MAELSELFQTTVELDSFYEHVKEYFLRSGYTEILFRDSFVLLNNSNENQYGLLNLAQSCVLSPLEDWNEIIRNHFDKVLNIPIEANEYLHKKTDFDKVKHDLRLQLYPESYISQFNEKKSLVYRTEIPGTISLIVVDLPSVVQSLVREDAEVWNVPEEEIFDIAFANTMGSVEVDLTMGVASGVKFKFLEGNDILTAVQVLDPHTMKDLVGTHGALISIPSRHLVISYPIEDIEIVEAIPIFGSLTSKMYAAGPGSLSPLLYWYHDAIFTALSFSIVGDEVSLGPPTEFIALLNRLGKKISSQ